MDFRFSGELSIKFNTSNSCTQTWREAVLESRCAARTGGKVWGDGLSRREEVRGH